jgi:hypothetical protein
MPHLTYLNIKLTPITNVGLRNLPNLSKLEELILNSSITNSEVQHCVCKLTKLRVLVMQHAVVGDVAIPYLCNSLSSLQTLEVRKYTKLKGRFGGNWGIAFGDYKNLRFTIYFSSVDV